VLLFAGHFKKSSVRVLIDGRRVGMVLSAVISLFFGSLVEDIGFQDKHPWNTDKSNQKKDGLNDGL
jgi:hypothetical protein